MSVSAAFPVYPLLTTVTLFSVQVASFGDYLAEQRIQTTALRPAKEGPVQDTATSAATKLHDASAPKKRHGAAAAADGPVEALTYRDPFAGVYKKYSISHSSWSMGLRLTALHRCALDTSSAPMANTSWAG